MRPRAPARAALALALLAASPRTAAAREIFRAGPLVLEHRASLREVLTVGRGTDAGDFEEALAASLPAAACLDPARFAACELLGGDTLPGLDTAALAPFLGDPQALLAELRNRIREAADLLAHSLRCIRAEAFADCPAFDTLGRRTAVQSLTRLRNRFDLRTDFGLELTLVYDHEWLAGKLDLLEGMGAAARAAPALLDLEDEIHLFGLRGDDDHRRWRHLLYRGYARYRRGPVDLVVGRQRIAWGVGRLWNPLDRFAAIPPLAIEGDQSPGVDAVDLRLQGPGEGFLELAAAPGRGPGHAGYALRLGGVVADTDLALALGRFDGALTAGASLARNLGEAALRIEAVVADPSRKAWPVGRSRPREVPPFLQLVVSVDRNFPWGNGLYVLVEHFYDGNALGFGRGRAGPALHLFEATDELPSELAEGALTLALPADLAAAAAGLGLAEPIEAELAAAAARLGGPFVRAADSDRLAGSRVVSLARHQTGLLLGYDLTPELRGELAALYDWNGRSAAVVPGLRFSPGGHLEISIGVQLFTGRRLSQFGSGHTLAFATAEWFF